jgi:septal ring factor EnvC (AmiA/AmiB activator)
MQASLSALREQQSELDRRRQSLAALETRQRLALRTASGGADSEAERALALAEQARDLDALTGELSRAGALRTQLMQLPGPVLRPADPGAAQGLVDDAAPAAPVSAAAPAFILPVQGRLIAGFGGMVPGMPASRGIMLGASGGAQAIAPGAGRIAFAGPYRGYGTIVIIDHGNGWTSLVTGLAQLDVRVGQDVLAGSPIGAAGPVRPVISLEIRHQGQPVNPLDLARF